MARTIIHRQLGTLIGICSLSACTEPSEPATLVLKNGTVHTMDADNRTAQALVVNGTTILHVGTNAEAEQYIGSQTEVIDLGGKTLLPGFTDAHTHLLWSATDLLNVDLFSAHTVEDLQTTVKAWADAHPEAEWVTGGGWSLSDFEGLLDKAQLDAVVPDRPVLLYAADGHTVFVNSLALTLAGITAETPDPEDGWIVHDENGEPNGLLLEAAIDLVAVLVPGYPDSQVDEGLTAGLLEAASFGITTIIDASVDDWTLSGYERAEQAGHLTLRVHAAPVMEPGDPENLTRLTTLRDRYQSDRIAVDCAKFFIDGIIESQTAYMIEPYLDGTNAPPTFSDSELQAIAIAVDTAGFQIHGHVIGDGATRQLLDALEAVQAANGPRDRRPLLAHLEVIDPEDLPRFAELGAYADFQPLWAYADPYITELTQPVIGEERSEYLYPIQGVLNAGGTVVAGSDWSVSSMNPLEGIEVAVTRQDPWEDSGEVLTPQHRVQVADAVRAYTSAGAAAAFSDDRLGSLEPGKLADFIILDADPFLVEPHALSDILVLQTFVDGERVYQRQEGERQVHRTRRSHAVGCK